MNLDTLMQLVVTYGPDLKTLVQGAIDTNGADTEATVEMIEAERLKLLPAPMPIDDPAND